MPRYAITSKAGRMVAGHNNRGVGTILDLTAEAAAAALERGELVDLDAPAVPDADADEGKKPARGKKAASEGGKTDA